MRNFTRRGTLLFLFLLLTSAAFAQTIYPTVGIVGSATANGWDASTPMNVNAGDPHQWSLTLHLSQGEAKFRANDNWSVNWGNTSFPSGSGVQNGPNIPIPTAGYYNVNFNDVTGAYNFETSTQPTYASVGVVGSATPGGWDNSTAMNVDPNDPHNWSITITLTSGEVKFRANNSWDVNWGGSTFPSGTAFQNGPNIPVSGGQYEITFNDVTRVYNFHNLNPTVYGTVGIIGSSTSNGWNESTPMRLASPGDPNTWTLTTFLSAGELKFRANNSWDVNWGGPTFPAGQGIPNGPNIQIPESSYYTIQFNDIGGQYNFTKLTPPTYATVGIIGTATSQGWDASTPMDQDAADQHKWTLTSITLFTGEAKFRANNSWDVNWGASGFPSGTGVQNGPNIPVPSGIYNVTFNDVTGEYRFDATSGPSGPIVDISPFLPTIDDQVTITYDANQGVSGLRNADKVYMHSGVILSGSDGTAWSNVVGNWGQDDGVGEMTRIPGTNKWQITLPSIRQYYSAGSTGPVFRLGMVFRNADGSQTGKSNTNGDIFVNINPGDYVRFLAPTANQIFGVVGEQILIRGEASDITNPFTVEINEGTGFHEVARVFDDQIINYNYTVGTASTVRVRLKAVLPENTIIVEKILSIVIRQPNNVAALPAGATSGVNYDPNDPTKATLVLLAPQKEFVYVVGDFNNWQTSTQYQMNVTPDGEYFWLELNGLEPQREYVYQYWVDGTIKIGDPYADKVADPFNDNSIPSDVYPNPTLYDRTQDGIATVLQTGQTPYQWVSNGVSGGRPAKENLVVYELLVRDFLGSHSYQGLTDTLAYLKRLGVNAIELLPIMEFEGNESWGYNPSYLFAPDKYYGTKNDLKAFIDKAHQEGFAVILDMVLNHQFGQSPMVRMYWDEALGKPSAESPWFNPDPTHPFNVGYDFNHESAYTKRYVDDVNRYWLQEYKFDGYRFDLSKGFTQTNNPNNVGAWSAYDQSRINILTRMTDEIRTVDPGAYVIMEHLAVNEEEKVLADYGIMLWGNMNHNYSDVINGDVTEDLNWALSSTRGWNEKNLVSYMESHDEERLMVRALNNGASSGDYDIRQLDVALERVKMASAFFYTLPGPKMMWQFGELGYDVSIDYNGRTGNKPIPWGDQDGINYYNDTARKNLYKAIAAMVNLVDDHNAVFEQGNFTWTPNGQFRRINVSHAAMNVTIVGNFGVAAGTMTPQFQHTGTWYDFYAGGRAVSVSSTGQTITLEPGEFHIYVDQLVQFPERGLVKTRVEIFTPENLQAVYSNSTIDLSWGDTSDGESGFVIERRSDNSSFAQLASVTEDVTTFSDNSITDGVTYEYRVKATSEVQPHSDWSNTANVNLALSAPTDLIAEAQGKNGILLMWSDNSYHETSYVIERAERKGNKTLPFAAFAEVGADVNSFIDNAIQNGREYNYRVYAKDNDEQSLFSNEATARKKGGKNIVSLYPNPVATELVVEQEGPEKAKFQILNLQGNVLSQFELGKNKNTMKVDVSNWKEGMYVVVGAYADGSVIREYIIVRK
jgi:glycosidase